MESVHLLARLSREQALTQALPVVVDMLDNGDGPYVDEGVLADLVALHWIRCEGDCWSMTAAGEQVMQALTQRKPCQSVSARSLASRGSLAGTRTSRR